MELKTPANPAADTRTNAPGSQPQAPAALTSSADQSTMESMVEGADGLECAFCGLVMGLEEECCPRCGLTVENTESSFAASASSPKSYQPGGLLPSEDHPMNCAACGMPVGESLCNNCGFRAVSEDEDLSWSDIVSPAVHANSRFAVSAAMQCDEQGLKQLANSLVWGEDGQRQLDPEQLAGEPPKWLPAQHESLWRDLVTDHSYTTYRDAVFALKRELLA